MLVLYGSEIVTLECFKSGNVYFVKCLITECLNIIATKRKILNISSELGLYLLRDYNTLTLVAGSTNVKVTSTIKCTQVIKVT